MRKILIFLFCLSVFGAYTKFTPGETWNDSKGNKINCHGGQVVYYEKAYYWFGEDRASGVSLYKSTDLYNWEKQTNAYTPSDTKDPNGNDGAKGRNLERPKVLYNDATKKWVMHIHWENGNNYNDAKVMVAVSDTLQGPYKFVNTTRPNGHDSRDQTTFKDNDGKAYHFGSTNTNTDMLVSELTTDYLGYTSKEFLSMAGKKLEAPCIWRVNDTYFGIYSLCTGWDPNKGTSAYTHNLFSTWTEIGVFANSSETSNTYSSQAAYVFKYPEYENAYIYIGDRWNSSSPVSSNTVWLPLSVRTGYPKIKWYSSWNLSVLQEANRYQRAKEIVEGNTYLLLEKESDAFISKTETGIVTADDGEDTYVSVQFESTEEPHVYKIKDAATNLYYESHKGTFREAPSSKSRAQLWRFNLESDGYYSIQNLNDKKHITRSNSDVTKSITLGEARSYGVYFDSNKFKYEAANIFSKNYRNEIRALMNKN